MNPTATNGVRNSSVNALEGSLPSRSGNLGNMAKRYLSGLAGLALATLPAVDNARAAINPADFKDVTVNDGGPNSFYGYDPRPGIGESGEVSANCVANPSWDLRAILWNEKASTLTFISGFDPLTTNDGFKIGDVFFDTNNAMTFPSRPVAADGYYIYKNPGAELCLDITGAIGSSLTWDFKKLAADSQVQSSWYNQNGLSDPWALVSTSKDTLLYSGTSEVTRMTDAQIKAAFNVDIGNNGGMNSIWSFELDTSVLTDQQQQSVSAAGSLMTGVTGYWTEQCGNDQAKFQLPASAVPEPGSLAATACFLGSALAIRFRPRGKKQ